MSRASQLRHKAQNHLKSGKLAEAIDTYKKLLQIESHNPNLYNELGDIYLRAEDRMQAILSFGKAVDHYEKVALYNNAVAVCKKILRVVPNRLESIFKLGELKAKQKFNCEASRMFIQYLELASADEMNSSRDNIIPKVESILELVPEDDELHARVAEVLTQIGLKIASAEVFAKLIIRSVENDDNEKTDIYRGKLDLLRESLSAEEQASIEEILAGSLELEDDGEELDEEPDLTVEEIDTKAAAESAGSDPVEAEPVVEEEPAVEECAEEPAPAREDETQPEPAAETAREYEIPSEPEPEPEPETGTGQEYEIPVEPAAEEKQEAPTAPEVAEEYVIDEAPADDSTVESDAGATIAKDGLSDILEAEDASNEATFIDTEKLAEEITSDVAEDDFRSHYDLGMAYIEMALYNEAIRELQISARSEQLQLRGLEMIGHCFLMLDNPRLAVKQLIRGLEIAMTTGGDNLGIHYNLGLAYEGLNEVEKAREHFEEVYIVDVAFRDISQKMKQYSTVS